MRKITQVCKEKKKETKLVQEREFWMKKRTGTRRVEFYLWND